MKNVVLWSWQSVTGLLVICLLAGCSGRDWKDTVLVKGEVFVDGMPGEGVTIEFHPVAGLDTEKPTLTKAMVNKDGSFAASTYEIGDGAPPGEYRLTFTWPTLNTISMSFDGDKLKGRYKDPVKTNVQVTVESGKGLDLGRIDLTTK